MQPKEFTGAKIFATRFSEGHLASALESGHIPAVLRRLQAIREEMAGDPPA